MAALTITLPKNEKTRLTRLASRYGLSLAELSLHVLANLSESLPFESITEYERPVTLKQSLHRAYREHKAGDNFLISNNEILSSIVFL